MVGCCCVLSAGDKRQQPSTTSLQARKKRAEKVQRATSTTPENQALGKIQRCEMVVWINFVAYPSQIKIF